MSETPNLALGSVTNCQVPLSGCFCARAPMQTPNIAARAAANRNRPRRRKALKRVGNKSNVMRRLRLHVTLSGPKSVLQMDFDYSFPAAIWLVLAYRKGTRRSADCGPTKPARLLT